MDIFQFIKKTKHVFQQLSRNKMNKARIHKYKKLPTSIADLRMLSLKSCYHVLFPNFYKRKIYQFTNEFFLDWESPTVETYQKNPREIIVIDSKNKYYAFTIHELFSIFHHDLIRSSVDYEPVYRIITLRRNFRCPTNPYSNSRFTIQEIQQFMAQLFLYDIEVEKYDFPEVFLFLIHASKILENVDILNGYQMTSYLNDFFEAHHLQFMEEFNNELNHSTWISQKAIKNQEIITDYFKNLLLVQQ